MLPIRNLNTIAGTRPSTRLLTPIQHNHIAGNGRSTPLHVRFAQPSVPTGSASAPVTDQSVPTGHQGLHSSLYGQGGAEEHDAGDSYRLRKEEDDGSTMVPAKQWMEDRDNEKPLGVYAIYDESQVLQYIGYSRNMVTAVRAHVSRVGSHRAAYVRAMVFANKAMATREHLEREVQSWVQEYAGGQLPAGNSTERDLWDGSSQGQGSSKVMSDAEAAQHAEKAAKLRLAMGEGRSAISEDPRTSEQAREHLKKAMEVGDWSEVIDRQTQDAVNQPPAHGSNNSPTSSSPASTTAHPEMHSNGPVVSPFSQPTVHRSVGSHGKEGGDAVTVMSVESADSVLNEVRPYLMADGGDVEVVEVSDGRIFLRLQGSCSTCASSASTMKLGIERALSAAFGSQLKEVIQVDRVDVVTTNVENINLHLDMLRGAIHSFGGKVEATEVKDGKATIKYKGPPAIGKGVTAAIKDRFTDIREVVMVEYTD